MEKVAVRRPCPKCGTMVTRAVVEYFGHEVHGAVLCDKCSKKWDRIHEKVKEEYARKYPDRPCTSCGGSGKISGVTCSDCRGRGKIGPSYYPSMSDMNRDIDGRW